MWFVVAWSARSTGAATSAARARTIPPHGDLRAWPPRRWSAQPHHPRRAAGDHRGRSVSAYKLCEFSKPKRRLRHLGDGHIAASPDGGGDSTLSRVLRRQRGLLLVAAVVTGAAARRISERTAEVGVVGEKLCARLAERSDETFR
jgi:hypothetical protein